MADTRRLFFGLALPEALQQQIIQWRAAQFPEDAGRPVAAANMHMTLAFLGDISAEKQKALSRLAGRISQPGFSLTLDDAGQWLRSRVVWIGPRQAPRGLLQLASLLRSQAARSGCYQSPQPFHPHITLYRHTSHAVAVPPRNFNWPLSVTEFVLYESIFERGRSLYKPIERWPLSEKEV